MGSKDEYMKGLQPEEKKRLPKFILDQMRLAEKSNFRRLTEYRRTLSGGRLGIFVLGAVVLTIYGYTMYAVKRETFLEDFKEPELEYIDNTNRL